jgi:hypothetical protein
MATSLAGAPFIAFLPSCSSLGAHTSRVPSAVKNGGVSACFDMVDRGNGLPSEKLSELHAGKVEGGGNPGWLKELSQLSPRLPKAISLTLEDELECTGAGSIPERAARRPAPLS